MKKITVSAAQFAVIPNKIKENTEKSCYFIEKAYKEGKPFLIALPETITTGFNPNLPVAEFYELVEDINGKSVKTICDLAKKLKINIVFPTYLKTKKKYEIYNSAVIINSFGKIVGVYSKTHPFPTERAWAKPGNKLEVFDLGAVKIGITICYEGDFPELSRILALKGAELIVRPAALLRSFEIWELTNRARAYDNHCYFLAANAVGADAGGSYYFGHSMIINPIAQKLAQARGTEEIIYAELDPDPLKYVTYGAKTPMIFEHLTDREVSLYKDILKYKKSSFKSAYI